VKVIETLWNIWLNLNSPADLATFAKLGIGSAGF
jgi:hypothetical protein